MRLRSRLVGLVFAILLPALLAAALVLRYVHLEERRKLERSMWETTRALAAVFDREIAQREAVLRTLAASPALLRGDLPAFYAMARRIAPSIERTIVLQDAQGRQLLNTRRPLGEPLPRASVFADLRVALGPRATLVSDLYWAPLGGQYSFAVEVPVGNEHGEPLYLAMGSFAQELQRVIEQQRLPEGWLAVVLDRSANIVARSRDPQRHVGQRPTEEFVRHLSGGSEGLYRARTRDGVEVNAYFGKAPSSGWTFVIGVPTNEALVSLDGASKRLVGLAAALIVLAVLAALWIARGLAHPVRELADAARRLGDGEPLVARRTGLAEADGVLAALADADARVREARTTLEQRVARAIAEREQAQSALARGQKLEALGYLTAGIAHHFNNVLQTLTTGLHAVERLSDDARVRRVLHPCREAIDRATKLTRQLAAFGMPQAQHAGPIDLAEELPRVQELLRSALPARISLELRVPPDIGAVRAEQDQLELALLNLVINARDALDGGGTVTIAAFREAVAADGDPRGLPAGEHLVVEVRDTGAGFAPEVLHRAFEPFFTTKGVGKGSGLGLAQVYAFAKQAGGTATIGNHPEGGAVVRLFLPRREADAAAAAPTPLAPTSAASGTGEHGRSITILLVDDDAPVRSVVVPASQAAGFAVHAAEDADRALELLGREDGIDLVFSDVVMPGSRDGVELAHEIGRRYPGLPVVLATGYAERLPRDNRFRVVAKPYRVEALPEVFAAALAAAREGGRDRPARAYGAGATRTA